MIRMNQSPITTIKLGKYGMMAVLITPAIIIHQSSALNPIGLIHPLNDEWIMHIQIKPGLGRLFIK